MNLPLLNHFIVLSTLISVSMSATPTFAQNSFFGVNQILSAQVSTILVSQARMKLGIHELDSVQFAEIEKAAFLIQFSSLPSTIKGWSPDGLPRFGANNNPVRREVHFPFAPLHLMPADVSSVLGLHEIWEAFNHNDYFYQNSFQLYVLDQLSATMAKKYLKHRQELHSDLVPTAAKVAAEVEDEGGSSGGGPGGDEAVIWAKIEAFKLYLKEVGESEDPSFFRYLDNIIQFRLEESKHSASAEDLASMTQDTTVGTTRPALINFLHSSAGESVGVEQQQVPFLDQAFLKCAEQMHEKPAASSNVCARSLDQFYHSMNQMLEFSVIK